MVDLEIEHVIECRAGGHCPQVAGNVSPLDR